MKRDRSTPSAIDPVNGDPITKFTSAINPVAVQAHIP
jgi:hypothetical protein